MKVAFLHGGGQGGWVWQETIDALRYQTGERAIEVLALDVPGCGIKRGRETGSLTLEDIARELMADIEASGMADLMLVGHSQAGQVMALMAGRRPQLFSRFVYVSCSIPLPGQSVQQMIGAGIQGSNPDEVGWPLDPQTTSLEERYAAMFCNDMDAAGKSAFLSKLGPDQWPLATYAYTAWTYDRLDAVPATFVQCLRDQILPARWQEVFAKRFKTERTVVIDAGHQVMTTRPHSLAEVLWHEALAAPQDTRSTRTLRCSASPLE